MALPGIANCKKCNGVISYGAESCGHCGIKNPLPLKYRISVYIASGVLLLFMIIIAPFAIIWAIGCEIYRLYKRYITLVNKFKRLQRIKRIRELKSS